MRAAVFERYGPPDVVQIREVTDPAVGAGEVLVKVRATTLSAADWRLRKAEPFFVRLMAGLTRPKRTVLGLEFAGVVEKAGADASRFGVGDRVFGSAGFAFGAHAERLAVSEDALTPAPDNLGDDGAAAILFGGVTALHFLRTASVAPGQKVLIYGASGCVGTSAVQLAKRFGATVTAVCSGANLDLVRAIGADEVIDYARGDFSSAGPVYDVVFDTVGKAGLGRSLRALRRGGILLQAAPAPLWWLAAPILAATGHAKIISGLARPEAGDREFFRRLIAAGELRPVIGARFAFEDIAEAHRYAESGRKVGSAVVIVA
ncbi:MAG TPA: NAD(P)-dependent alcohol dehydrogenase [Caulobacteraceae bacterium]|nr:NAD(P)-dependent alcohol dehydrogenase [Caulobacteraceae bacterium]